MELRITFRDGTTRTYSFVEDIQVEDGFLFFVGWNENNTKVVAAYQLANVVSYETGIF